MEEDIAWRARVSREDRDGVIVVEVGLGLGGAVVVGDEEVVAVGLESVVLGAFDGGETGREIAGELDVDSNSSMVSSCSAIVAGLDTSVPELEAIVSATAKRGNCAEIISSCSCTRVVLVGALL